MSSPNIPRLTSLAHGGGCGCKIAPSVLSEILNNANAKWIPPQLLAGNDNNEDAAVYQINENQAIVATTDFFTPIVDNPFDFGKIAATNAISDIYAMGAQPIMALALLGMPINVLPIEVIQQITAGGESVCSAAGIPIAGGHSIDTLEPIYGLVVIGMVDPKKLKRNNGAKAGDKIILSKPLGIGILSAALKKEILSPAAYAKMIELTTQLNTPGQNLSNLADVHALTDVTGFGLTGHLLEICRGSQLSATIEWNTVPVINEALEHVKNKVFTGASTRNWASFGKEIYLATHLTEWQQQVLSDPQTSGGLLVACAPSAEHTVLDIFHQNGFAEAKTIGEFHLSKNPNTLNVI